VHPTWDEKTNLPLKKRTSNRVHMITLARIHSRIHLTPPERISSRPCLITQKKTLPVKIKVIALQLRIGDPRGRRVSRCPRLCEVREGEDTHGT
jgi:hypothetical protein